MAKLKILNNCQWAFVDGKRIMNKNPGNTLCGYCWPTVKRCVKKTCPKKGEDCYNNSKITRKEG